MKNKRKSSSLLKLVCVLTVRAHPQARLCLINYRGEM